MNTQDDTELQAALAEIARRLTPFGDLIERKSDSEDFRDVHVSSMRSALLAAFKLGEASASLVQGMTQDQVRTLAYHMNKPIILRATLSSWRMDTTGGEWVAPIFGKTPMDVIIKGLREYHGDSLPDALSRIMEKSNQPSRPPQHTTPCAGLDADDALGARPA